MGNCSQKSCSPCSSDVRASGVRVWTETGQLIEFERPKIAREVLSNFPGGYGVFRGGEMRWPLEKEERLKNGQVYYALPVGKGDSSCRRRAREYLSPPPPARSVGRDGVWRVKLAISVEELEQILAGQVNMESLILKLRMGQGLNMRN